MSAQVYLQVSAETVCEMKMQRQEDICARAEGVESSTVVSVVVVALELVNVGVICLRPA